MISIGGASTCAPSAARQPDRGSTLARSSIVSLTMTTTTETAGLSALPMRSDLLDLGERISRPQHTADPLAGNEHDEHDDDQRQRQNEFADAAALADDGDSEAAEENERHQWRGEDVGDTLHHALVAS